MIRFFLMLSLLVLSCPLPAAATDEPIEALSETELEWLELVEPILSPLEQNVFEQLPARRRAAFIDAFWRARDPDPATERNEYQDEYLRRIRYADENLGWDSPRKGSQTERGQIYIVFGEPRSNLRYEGSRDLYPIQVWHYSGRRLPGLPVNFYLTFYRPFGIGEYRLYNPEIDSPKSLVVKRLGRAFEPREALRVLQGIDPELARASLAIDAAGPHDFEFGFASSLATQQLASVQAVGERSAPDGYARRFALDEGRVETEISFDSWSFDTQATSVRAPDGSRFLVYAAEAPLVRLLQRRSGQQPELALELDLVFLDKAGRELGRGTRFSRLPLNRDQRVASEFSRLCISGMTAISEPIRSVRLLIRPAGTSSVGQAQLELESVPGPASPEISLSSPLLGILEPPAVGLARGILQDELLAAPPELQPGSAARAFWPVGTTVTAWPGLSVSTQIFGPAGSAAPSGLTLRVRLDGVESNARDPKVSSLESTVPIHGEFSTAGVLDVTVPLELGTAPTGRHLLQLVLVGEGENTLARRQLNFHLAPEGVDRPWNLKQPHAPVSHPAHRLERAEQLRVAGLNAFAVEELQQALVQAPGQIEIVLALARLFLELRQPNRLLDLLGASAASSLATTGPLDSAATEQLALVAAAYVLSGHLELAADCYARAVESNPGEPRYLSALAAVEHTRGNSERAAELCRRALSLDPEQPRVRELLALLEAP